MDQSGELIEHLFKLILNQPIPAIKLLSLLPQV